MEATNIAPAFCQDEQNEGFTIETVPDKCKNYPNTKKPPLPDSELLAKMLHPWETEGENGLYWLTYPNLAIRIFTRNSAPISIKQATNSLTAKFSVGQFGSVELGAQFSSSPKNNDDISE